MKRHPFDVLSFTAGAIFVGLGVAFLSAGADVVDSARWVWPLLLLALGAAGLASALRREPDSDGSADS
jgi:fatty acid desaturase